ncbi:glucose-6-phosphate dehydrogenase [Leifsonia sp. F6_8S_P_1B]|uniref:Glucose-6-phosphate 1-dehydrogenase n=1 Tax=Leifsonia williamsii TaxID=3035919 RepID=A0ABT8KBR2_9MICO|nr:glucose-6-phosphate dehydrogenase [Leifsonia williamsii]MDN4614901.1 glucose-6-phosphate dehydrogenase [Leifsonia williamsii]
MKQSIGTLVILGASGDLSSRLLLPAIGQLLTLHPDRRFRLLGAGMEEWDDERWTSVVRKAFEGVEAKGDAIDELLKDTSYIQADVTEKDDLQRIFDACEGAPALYFALPPAVAAKACTALEAMDRSEGLTLALEKPFGLDADSAQALNTQLLKLVPEERIHRVDHFLGRSTVFNMIGLRFANSIFEPVWSGEHIDRVDIVYDETLGLEDRARYYDGAGALIDMIQSHLLQVLAVFAMEPPATLEAVDFRDAKAAVLRATRVRGDDPATSSRRARYTAGSVEGKTMPSYADEQGVDPSRKTETLAEVVVEVDTWRWAGVPFTLRSGKALGRRRREVVITFKPARHIPSGLHGSVEPTRLRIMLAPDEMALELNINGPGDPYEIDRAALTAEFGPGELLAYAEVLEGILDGDPTLSVRADTAVQCWRIVEPVIASWKADDVPLEEYAAGSEGPADWPVTP